MRSTRSGVTSYAPCAVSSVSKSPSRLLSSFTSERGSPFSPAGFRRMVQRTGDAAKLGFRAHPHMLRHATGYKLANDGVDTRTLQAYLGHRSKANTVRYTELAPTRFKDLWR